MILSLEEAKEWLRVDINDDDQSIQMLIDAAELYLTNATGKEFDDTNKQAKMLCLILVTDWFENRDITNFKVGDKLRFTVQSMMAQLMHC